MAYLTNFLFNSVIPYGGTRTVCREGDIKKISGRDVHQMVMEHESLPASIPIMVTFNGKKICNSSDTHPFEVRCEDSDGRCDLICLRVSLLTPGGKGGFGSMLRAIGAQIEKTTNKEACRDLSGRRLRNVNAEKRIKDWISKQAERKLALAKKRKEKIEKLKREPKITFEDPEYFKMRSDMMESVDDAISYGLKKSKSSSACATITSSAAASAPCSSAAASGSIGAVTSTSSSSLSEEEPSTSSSSPSATTSDVISEQSSEASGSVLSTSDSEDSGRMSCESGVKRPATTDEKMMTSNGNTRIEKLDESKGGSNGVVVKKKKCVWLGLEDLSEDDEEE